MKHFGTTIAETIEALNYRPHLGSNKKSAEDKRNAVKRIVVTIGLFVAALFAVNYQSEIPVLGEVGKALISAIFGYWIK